jgi:hypothetical protein
MLWRKRRNSIAMYSARSRFRCIIMAHHDFRFHANAAIAIYAQLLTRS